MAQQAECTQVVQITLAAAFSYRPDMVGFPERSTRLDGAHPVHPQAFFAGHPAGAFERSEDGKGIGITNRAPALIAREDLIAQITGVRAQTPLMNAECGAESSAALCEDLQIAPAAKGKAVWTAPEIGPPEDSARLG